MAFRGFRHVSERKARRRHFLATSRKRRCRRRRRTRRKDRQVPAAVQERLPGTNLIKLFTAVSYDFFNRPERLSVASLSSLV